MLLEQGISITPLRLAVLKVLGSAPKAFAAGEILKEIRITQGMNKVTLYRILDTLVRGGLVRKVTAGSGAIRYELAGKGHEAHPHLVCTSCGKIRCLEVAEFSSIMSSLCKLCGFHSEDVEICVSGICPACESKRQKDL